MKEVTLQIPDNMLSGYLPLIDCLKYYVEERQAGASNDKIEEERNVKIRVAGNRRFSISHDNKEMTLSINGRVMTAIFRQ